MHVMMNGLAEGGGDDERQQKDRRDPKDSGKGLLFKIQKPWTEAMANNKQTSLKHFSIRITKYICKEFCSRTLFAIL